MEGRDGAKLPRVQLMRLTEEDIRRHATPATAAESARKEQVTMKKEDDEKLPRVRLVQLTEEDIERHRTPTPQPTAVTNPTSRATTPCEERAMSCSRRSIDSIEEAIERSRTKTPSTIVTPTSVNTASGLCDPMVQDAGTHPFTYPPEGGCLPHIRQRLYGQRILLNENRRQRKLRLQQEIYYRGANKKALKSMDQDLCYPTNLCHPIPRFHEESKPLDPNTLSYRSAYTGGDKALVYPPEGGCLPNVSQRLYGHRVLLNETEEEQRKRLKRETKYRSMNSARELRRTGAPRPTTPLIDIFLPRSRIPPSTANVSPTCTRRETSSRVEDRPARKEVLSSTASVQIADVPSSDLCGDDPSVAPIPSDVTFPAQRLLSPLLYLTSEADEDSDDDRSTIATTRSTTDEL